MKSTASFCAFALAVMSVWAGGPGPILRNAGFEEADKGNPVAWSLPPYYSRAPGMGRNGTAAIAYSFVSNCATMAPVAQEITLEPTAKYRVSCWMRTEGVKPPVGEPGAKIGVEWRDGAGRYEGAYCKSLVGTHDWTHVSFVTPQMPREIQYCRIQVYAGYGKTPGKAWFDDVKVEKVESKPLGGLYSGAYRNTCWGDEPVRFAATLDIAAPMISSNAADVSLRYRDKSGAVRNASPVRLSADMAEFSLRASDLETGTQSVVCVVATNGVMAGEASCRIARMQSDPGWRVRFDRHGRTLVDGKPFFPLGMYMGEVTAEELAVYREGPFNCMMPYREPSREMLDLCDRKGLKVIYPLKEVYSHTGWAKSRKILTVEDEESYVARRVGEFKSHPAILAWYLNDEFGPEYAAILARRRSLFERLDPDHPTWNCLYQVHDLALYMDSIDCIGTDPYPVARESIARAAYWTSLTKRNTAGSRPIWMIPQSFSWSWFKSGRKDDRMPTEDEMRAMSWQMVACGANGLVYYAFHQMRRNCGEDFPRDWTAVKTVSSEIARHADVFLSDPGPAFKSDMQEDFLPVRTWRRGDDAFVLAVNATPKRAVAKVALEGSWETCSTMFGTPANFQGGNSLALDIPPWGISLSRLIFKKRLIFEDGEYRADIVLPASPNGVEKFAAEELAYHFKKAFGKEPEVVGEDALDLGRNQFHIYVGATKAATAAGLPAGLLADEEHVVKTAGNGLYLLGGDADTTYDEAVAVRKTAMRGTLYAVYDFLESEMGVKWLWPGKTGEVVPRRTSLKVGALDRRAQEPLEFRQFIFGQCRKLKTGWSNDAVAEEFFRDEERFLLRQRHGNRKAFNHGHSFTKWWNLHHENHPEYFNLLPNGKRMPQRAPELCTICVSEPGVKMQRVADWCKWWEGESKRRHPLLPWVNCCENDAAGLCICERCRSWDGPDPRFEKSPYWNGSLAPVFDEKCMGRKFMSEVGLSDGARWVMYPTCPSDELAASLSDRYVRFYNEVATEAKKHNPDAKTIGYAYANYIEPPMKTRVGPDTMIIFVPRSYFPYDKAESDAFRRQWSGWCRMGATRMVYRPNYMLAGGNHPIDMARLVLDDFAYAYTNGMFAAYHDELTGAYSAQAMFLYAMVRSLRDPLRGYEKAREDMLAGFGSAAKCVNGYFDLVERHTTKWTLDAFREIAMKNVTDNYLGGSFRNPNAVLGDYFDDQFFVEGYRLLDEAKAAASGDDEVAARIEFLRKGLRDTELGRLCRIAQKASDAAPEDAAKKAAYGEAFKALVDYRHSVEADCVCNYSRHAHWERQYVGWPHEVRGAKPKPNTSAEKKKPFGWNEGE